MRCESYFAANMRGGNVSGASEGNLERGASQMSETAWSHLSNARPAGRPNAAENRRNALWCDMYRAGKTAQQIGDEYGVTRERVCQILRKENVIAHKAQRRQLANELIEQDREEVRAQKRRLEQQVMDIVKAGASCATAAAQCGIDTPRAIYICKKNGVESQHGRWHDFSERVARIKHHLEAGMTVSAAIAARAAEENRKIGYQWFYRNHPELVQQYRRKPAPKKAPALKFWAYPDGRKAATAVYDIEADWTPERTESLIKLWLSGTSAQQVVDIFGPPFTRNSILGKVHRLRLAGLLKV